MKLLLPLLFLFATSAHADEAPLGYEFSGLLNKNWNVEATLANAPDNLVVGLQDWKFGSKFDNLEKLFASTTSQVLIAKISFINGEDLRKGTLHPYELGYCWSQAEFERRILGDDVSITTWLTQRVRAYEELHKKHPTTIFAYVPAFQHRFSKHAMFKLISIVQRNLDRTLLLGGVTAILDHPFDQRPTIDFINLPPIYNEYSQESPGGPDYKHLITWVSRSQYGAPFTPAGSLAFYNESVGLGANVVWFWREEYTCLRNGTGSPWFRPTKRKNCPTQAEFKEVYDATK